MGTGDPSPRGFAAFPPQRLGSTGTLREIGEGCSFVAVDDARGEPDLHAVLGRRLGGKGQSVDVVTGDSDRVAMEIVPQNRHLASHGIPVE
jgi:hypothetical protein